MKKLALYALVLFMLAASASAQRKYLTLGGDPQEPGLQPTPGVEEVFVSNEDICDSGWGTGSGVKVPGCYRKGVAGIRNIETRIVTAIYFCGNRPTDQHIGTGKAVPREVLEKEVAKYLADPNAATKEDVGRLHATLEELSAKLDNLATKDDVLNAINLAKGRPLCGESWRTGRRWGCAAVVAVVVVVVVNALPDDDNHEEVTTKPPCQQLPCANGNSMQSLTLQPLMPREPKRMGFTVMRW